MIEHRPKTAALMAYAEDLLSQRGRARVERHLAGCALCRRELSAILTYSQVSEEARTAPVPELDFDRMEMALGHEAQRVSQEIVLRRKRAPLVWVALAAAAALLAVYVAWPDAELPPPTAGRVEPAPLEPRELEQREPDEAPLEATSPALAARVTLRAGHAELVSEGVSTPIELGAALPEGSELATGAGGLVHVRLSDGTGFVASAETSVTLRRAREDGVELELARGRIDSTVAPLRNGSTYVILAGGHGVEVQGTRFAVSFTDTVLAVDLAEGGVSVRMPDGERIRLRAPVRWRSSGTAAGAPDVATARELAAQTEQPAEPTPVTLAHPELVRWEIDGTPVHVAGPVQLGLLPGEHEVRGWDGRGRLFTALLPVGTQPTFIEPGALQPGAPRVREGTLPPEDIERVIARGRTQLSRCYERAMRLHPDLQVQGRLQLRVQVGVAGDVRRVSVLGAEARDTAELRECITTYAERWTFPPPVGGPVTFQVPLAFSARP